MDLTVEICDRDYGEEEQGVGPGWYYFGKSQGVKERKVLKDVLGPLEDMRVREGGSFVVVYPWPKEVCASWEGGAFEMVNVMEYYEEAADLL